MVQTGKTKNRMYTSAYTDTVAVESSELLDVGKVHPVVY